MPAEKSSQPEADLYRLYEEALRLLHEKKYEKAKATLVTLKERFPGDLEVLAKVNEYLRVCERKLTPAGREKQTPGDVIDQGVMYHNFGDYSKALQCYTQALSSEKADKAVIHYAIAASETALGETAKAIEDLRTAFRIRGELRFTARNDPDFQVLHDTPEFRELVKPQKSEV